MEKVSIIVPVYNVHSYLNNCLESLVRQTYKNIEILLIDDGSTDGSGNICDEWAVKDARIKVFHKENGGVSSARNVGIANATGEYLMAADGDDFCEETFVEKMYNAITNQDCDMALCGHCMEYTNKVINYETPYETGIYDVKEIFSALFLATKNNESKRLFAAFWAAILKRSIIEKYNLRCDTDVTRAEDLLFLLDYTGYCKKVAILNESLYHYIQRESSLVHTQYIVPTMPAIQSLMYIQEQFIKISDNHNIDKELYMQSFLKLHLERFLWQITNIYNLKNTSGKKEKLALLKFILDNARLIEAIKALERNTYKKLSFKHKVTSAFVMTQNLTLIRLWGEFFNLTKFVVRKIFKTHELSK